MKLLPPLPPVLRRRSALVLGTGLLTSLVIGGVAANAQAGSGHATESKALTSVAAVDSAPGDLVDCASIDPSELKLTPAQPATAIAIQADGKPLSVKGIAVKAVPAQRATGKAVTGKAIPATIRPAKGTAVKAVPGKVGAKAVGSGGEAIATLEAVPVCVAKK
jgi:hypothetical protein